MAIPYESESNMPLGLSTVTIESVTYIQISVDMPSFENRIISRTDANGTALVLHCAGSDQITGTWFCNVQLIQLHCHRRS